MARLRGAAAPHRCDSPFHTGHCCRGENYCSCWLSFGWCQDVALWPRLSSFWVVLHGLNQAHNMWKDRQDEAHSAISIIKAGSCTLCRPMGRTVATSSHLRMPYNQFFLHGGLWGQRRILCFCVDVWLFSIISVLEFSYWVSCVIWWEKSKSFLFCILYKLCIALHCIVVLFPHCTSCLRAFVIIWIPLCFQCFQAWDICWSQLRRDPEECGEQCCARKGKD